MLVLGIFIGINVGLFLAILVTILITSNKPTINKAISRVHRNLPSQKGGFLEVESLSEHIDKVLHD